MGVFKNFSTALTHQYPSQKVASSDLMSNKEDSSMANHPEAVFNEDVMMIMSYIWGTKKPKPRPDLSPLGPARFQFPDERSRPLTNSNHKVAYFSTPMPSELSRENLISSHVKISPLLWLHNKPHHSDQKTF